MDHMKLELVSVDQIQPILIDLYDTLNKLKVQNTFGDHMQGLKKWLEKLNTMKAMDELQGDDTRQFAYELDKAYAAYHKLLDS